MILSLDEARSKYGEIKDNAWADVGRHMVLIDLQSDVSAQLVNSATGKPTGHVYCNRDMAEPLENAFKAVCERGLLSELKTFDGCYCIRSVWGKPDSPSTHSYGLAVDINAATNKLGTPGDMSDALAKCFTDQGFTWGKRFMRQDPMHFSYAWE